MISASDLASEYKRRGYDKFYAWDKFIIDRSLQPEMNAKEFYDIFETVTAAQEQEKQKVNIVATHFDNLIKENCQLTTRGDGVIEVVWESGHTGSYPPYCLPSFDRFIALATK